MLGKFTKRQFLNQVLANPGARVLVDRDDNLEAVEALEEEIRRLEAAIQTLKQALQKL